MDFGGLLDRLPQAWQMKPTSQDTPCDQTKNFPNVLAGSEITCSGIVSVDAIDDNSRAGKSSPRAVYQHCRFKNEAVSALG